MSTSDRLYNLCVLGVQMFQIMLKVLFPIPILLVLAICNLYSGIIILYMPCRPVQLFKVCICFCLMAENCYFDSYSY